MGSLLQWIKETLDTLQRNQMVMDDLQEKSRQQHEEIKRVLTLPEPFMTDLQVIITALGVDKAMEIVVMEMAGQLGQTLPVEDTW